MDRSLNPVFELHVAPPAKQNRWAVFFRFFLLIPQYFVLYGLLIGAVFLTFLGWFAAIFIGRNPFHDYVAGVIRWYARVSCYLLMVTNQYPPFALGGDPDYPVKTSLERGTLGRVSVLFRIILVIPVLIVAQLVGTGMFVFGFVAWLITLFRGTLPLPLHIAFQATIRFQTRVYAYITLTQNRYPRGLFGDKLDNSPISETLGLGVSTEASATPIVSDASDVLVADTASFPSMPPYVEGPPPQDDGERSTSSSADRVDSQDSWRQSLTEGARRVLIGQIVLGALFVPFQIWNQARLNNVSVSPPIWSLVYRGDVQNLNNDVLNSQASMFSASLNWAVVASECGQITRSLDKVETAPQYPIAEPNRSLLLGIDLIKAGSEGCSTAVKSQSTSQLASAADEFLAGSDTLQVFLNQSVVGTVFQF